MQCKRFLFLVLPATNAFTVIILNFARPLDVKIKIFENMRYLSKILIIKNSNETTFTASAFRNIQVPVEVIYSRKNSLNNRYIHYRLIKTEAVLNLDDDFDNLTQDMILAMYFVWKKHPKSIVGLFERSHERIDWIQETPLRYNLILGEIMFASRKYYELYSNFMDRRIHSLVDVHMTGEDIAFNFLVSFLTQQPHWLVEFPRFNRHTLWKHDLAALSKRSNHDAVRSDLIGTFTEVSELVYCIR